MRRRYLLSPMAFGVLILAPWLAHAADPAAHAEDEAAIRATAKQYLAALKRGDSKALLEFWVADGDFVDELGQSHPAREVFAAEGRLASEGPPADAKITNDTIRFLTSDVAIEDGTSEASAAANQDVPAVRGRFAAIWVKKDGKWRLASLRESRLESPASEPQLADLAWMVGEWSAQNADKTLELSAHWNSNHTFLLRDLKVRNEGQVVFSGTQRIGFDPITRQIRSWIFDSDGGYGEGLWAKEGNAWVVQATGVLPDGRRTSATNVYASEGEDTITWKSTGALVNGQAMPELNIKLVRKPAAK